MHFVYDISHVRRVETEVLHHSEHNPANYFKPDAGSKSHFKKGKLKPQTHFIYQTLFLAKNLQREWDFTISEYRSQCSQ